MKKVTFLLSGILIICFLLSSCNNKYNCSCTWQSGTPNPNFKLSATVAHADLEVKASSYRKAGEKCEEMERLLESKNKVPAGCKLY